MTMKVIESLSQMRSWSRMMHHEGHTIGLVPTMGYLHEGHLSLIQTARKHSDRTVVSIFVNPTQFAPGEDLEAYPRDFQRDRRICEEQGADVVFYPSNEIMYPEDHKTYVVTEDLAGRLCGASRPIHFKGVTTIVTKLFNIVEPDVAVFGQKDAQQALIIKRMVRDLNFDVEILISPTVREEDGLAMSSRNKYMTHGQRRQAPVLYQSLQMAKDEFVKGDLSPELIKNNIIDNIKTASEAKIDYVQIVNTEDFTETDLEKGDILIALAVFFGKARLIDNVIIKR